MSMNTQNALHILGLGSFFRFFFVFFFLHFVTPLVVVIVRTQNFALFGKFKFKSTGKCKSLDCSVELKTYIFMHSEKKIAIYSYCRKMVMLRTSPVLVFGITGILKVVVLDVKRVSCNRRNYKKFLGVEDAKTSRNYILSEGGTPWRRSL